jgi:DNA invertase Pin-like site-specific DNA recombinase
MATVAGYIRRSHDGEAPVSKEVQEQTVLRLAEARGLIVDRWYKDWGKSGLAPDGVGDTLPEILAHRPKALEMMRDVEAGDVAAILAYRQDRLARDSFTVHLMCRIAKRASVPIIIPRGDITAREQRLLTAVEGGMDEEEGTRAKERVGAAMDTMRNRGDDFGPAPLGWTKVALTEDGVNSRGEPAKAGARVLVRTDPARAARVVELFREIGSYNATARRLNHDGVAPPNPRRRRGSAGEPMWSAATVRDIVQREAPELAKRVGSRPRTARAFLLRGVLRCHCGAPMTAGWHPRGVVYYCNRGKRGAHQPHVISERRLLPWVRLQAARLRLPSEVEMDADEPAPDTADKRRRLEAARDLVGEAAYAAALAAIEAEAAAGQERARIVQDVPPALDWEWSVPAINAWLRAAFEYIELGTDLMPVHAEPLVPEWWA